VHAVYVVFEELGIAGMLLGGHTWSERVHRGGGVQLVEGAGNRAAATAAYH
jgi:hypothetical protein